MEAFSCNSSIMARLTISSIKRTNKDESCWKEPVIYSAILIGGLSVLIASSKLLENDIRKRDFSS